MTPTPPAPQQELFDVLDELYKFVDGLDPDFIIRERISIIKARIRSRSLPAPASTPASHDNVCAEEDFCKGCDNFDPFFNSCKLAAYKTSVGGKKEVIHPRTNGARWLLSIVGCSSDTRISRAAADAATLAENTMVLNDVLRFVETYESFLTCDFDNSEIYGVKSVNLKEHIESLRRHAPQQEERR